MEPLQAGKILVTGRPVADTDRAFLRAVYASTRVEELALVPWTDAQKQAFIDHQFNAQDRHYRNHYLDTKSEWLLLRADDCNAGRLYLQRGEKDILIVDISLVPAFRGRGIGGAVLRQVLAEAASAGKRVLIHVEHVNPARRLYERLGFCEVSRGPVYAEMAWTADGP